LNGSADLPACPGKVPQCRDQRIQLVELREPAPVLFNTLEADEIYTQLAEKLGILYKKGGLYDILNNFVDPRVHEHGLNLNEGFKLDIYKKHTTEEIYDQAFRGWKHNTEKQNLNDLKKTGFMVKWDPPREHYNYYFFPGSQTRHPFYFNHLKKTGEELKANMAKVNFTFPGDNMDEFFDEYQPIPHWIENSEFRAPPEYDLWVVNWMTPYFTHDASGMRPETPGWPKSIPRTLMKELFASIPPPPKRKICGTVIR